MTYDPNKTYSWNPDDVFTLSGREFGLILNTVRAILSTEQAAQILLANKTNEILEAIMAANVEKGVLKEVTESNPLTIVKDEKS